MGNENEKVLCISAEVVRHWFKESKFVPASVIPLKDIAFSAWNRNRGGPVFLPRKEAENNEAWKHVISYSVVNMGDVALTYERGTSGGEGRLYHKISCGVGGHVPDTDFEWAEVADAYYPWEKYPGIHITEEKLRLSALGEINQEIMARDHPDRLISEFGTLQYIGMISDDSDSVGRVHLGLLYEFSLHKTMTIEPREDCLKNVIWRTGGELGHIEPPEVLESWSQIVADKVMRPPVSTFFHGI